MVLIIKFWVNYCLVSKNPVALSYRQDSPIAKRDAQAEALHFDLVEGSCTKCCSATPFQGELW